MLAYKIKFTIVEDRFPEANGESYFLSKCEAEEAGRRYVEDQEGSFERAFWITEIVISEEGHSLACTAYSP